MTYKKYIFEYEPNTEEKNIDYVFERLLLAIVQSANYDKYKKSKEEFEKILLIVTKWISLYVNTKDISKIEIVEFDNVKQTLYELDTKYLSCDGLYAEEAFEWILQLEIILEKIKKGSDNINGIQ